MTEDRVPGGAKHARRASRILIIEDSRDQREMYAEYLRFRGYRVFEATDGQAALVAALSFRPDLVVMDLSMPHVDGWEATRRLRSDPRTRGIPVLACTAHRHGSALERALDAGCDGVVVKPYLPEQLVVEIERILARRAAAASSDASARLGC